MTEKRHFLADSRAAPGYRYHNWSRPRSTSSGSCGSASFYQVTYFGCLNHPLQICQLRVRKVIKLGSKDDAWRVVSDVSHSVNKYSHNPNPHVATSWTLPGSSAITAFQDLQICGAMATETVQQLPQGILKPEWGGGKEKELLQHLGGTPLI